MLPAVQERNWYAASLIFPPKKIKSFAANSEGSGPKNDSSEGARRLSDKMRPLINVRNCSRPCLLLIVVAGLLSCAQTRLRLNEVGAQSSLRAVRKAETTYRSQNQNRFGTLQELHSAGLVDAELASGIKDGYRFDVAPAGQDSYTATAVPLEYDVTGSWSFYLDESGVIRGSASKGRTAGIDDAPVRDQ